MPELPEVEITRRHLAHVVDGASVVDVVVTHPRTARHNSGPEEVEQRLMGRTFLSLARTGKFLHSEMDDGQLFVAHLGMSGRFAVDGDDEPHTHFRIGFDNGHEIRFIDPRTFGFVAVYDSASAASGLRRLGADALVSPPEASQLAASLQGRTARIKALLLDQALISGLGNIYADEALHLAGIHPLRQGGDLADGEVERLLQAISDVLASAIDNGGTSLDDLAYLLPDGRAGENLRRLLVYGRTDQPCLTCGTPIRQVRVRARSTHFCPSCQRAGS